LIDALVRRFSESEFNLLRGQTNVPFLPLAWVDVTGYKESSFEGAANLPAIDVRQRQVSEGAFLPIPVGRRDLIVIGEWLGYTNFDFDLSHEDLEVLSVSIPIGWMRQTSPDWQVAAFVAPLGHSSRDDGWYWETMGGVFARRIYGDSTAWIFGAYFDVGPLESFYTPYIGATFILNRQWSIEAVLPWPGVSYAPNPDTLFRLGISPSGTSWSAEPGVQHPRTDMSAWNIGLRAERQVASQIWLGFETGVSALRGLTFIDSNWQSPQTKLNNSAYAMLTLNFRPSAPPKH
jgi:hypothetical protein